VVKVDSGRCVRFLILGLALLSLSGCAQSINSLPATLPANPPSGSVKIEVEPTISADEYVQGLRKAKALLLDLPILTPAETAVSSQEDYQAFIQNYLDDPRSTKRVIQFYQQLLQLEGTSTITNFTDPTLNIVIDNDEPSSLIGYIYQNELDFRGVLTANYCVSNFEAGLSVKSDCVTRGRRNLNMDNLNSPITYATTSMPMDMRAGALSTQAFLRRFEGALNFRRPAAAREYFLCRNYPDAEEPEGWTESNGQLHPFYWTPAGADQNCQSCHQTLNKVRGFFTGFGRFGEVQMGQRAARLDNGSLDTVAARTINSVEVATLALPDYQNLYGKSPAVSFESNLTSYHGIGVSTYSVGSTSPAYPKLSEYGKTLSGSQAFTECTAQRFYNLAMGISQNINNRLPDRIQEQLVRTLEVNNYNLKSLLLEIFSSTDFLDR